MKVCLINTYDSTGGAAIACQRLLRALNRQDGVDARMLVASGKTDDDRIIRLDRSVIRKWQFRFNLLFERLQFKPYHNREVNEFYFSLADTGMDISKHPAVREADIIHLHWINLGFLSIDGIRKLGRLGKPIVWTMHDMWAFTGGCHYSGDCQNFRDGCGHCPFLKTPWENDLSHKMNGRKTFFDQFHFVACSQWLQQEAMHSGILGNADIRSIPNPIDLGIFRPGDQAASRQHLGLDPNAKYLLFAAANLDDYRKGFRYLVEALQLMASQMKGAEDLRLLVFGRQKGDFVRLPFPVDHLGSLDSTSAIVEAYRASDLFVIPSLQDNLPNTIVEAMACGVPVVGFNSGGIPEMIDHRNNGYLAHRCNAADLAEGMQYILDRPETGAAARTKAERVYDPDAVAGQYCDLYETLLPS